MKTWQGHCEIFYLKKKLNSVNKLIFIEKETVLLMFIFSFNPLQNVKI